MTLPPGLLGEDLGRLTVSSKLFEEKTARERTYQYDGNPEKQGPAWRSDIFDYFVSKCTAAGPWLEWAEQQGAREITAEELHRVKMSGFLMTDELSPIVLSHHLWGFLQHCLSGSARQTLKNTGRHDGLNVWRKLTLEINSRTACVRQTLRNRCQRVAQAPNNGAVWQALADWDTLYREYLDAGGHVMDTEDRKGQMLRILPKELRRDVFRRMNDFRTIEDIKEWIREQLELEKDWDAADRSAARPRTVGVVDQDDAEPSAAVPGPTEEDMDALLALTEDSSPEEVLAVQKRFQRYNGSKPWRPRPGPPRAAGGQFTKDEARLPGDARGREQKCVNCGKAGHMAAQCRLPKREPGERPCFGCGEVGHVSANCPKRSRPLKVLTTSPGGPVSFGCIEVVTPAAAGPEQPRRADGAAGNPGTGSSTPSVADGAAGNPGTGSSTPSVVAAAAEGQPQPRRVDGANVTTGTSSSTPRSHKAEQDIACDQE